MMIPTVVSLSYFTDGLGHNKQSWLCCTHMSQYERMGERVETGNILSVQLFIQVSRRYSFSHSNVTPLIISGITVSLRKVFCFRKQLLFCFKQWHTVP